MPRIISALVIAALTMTLTGCGAGLNASTRQFNQVTDGVEATVKTEGNNIKVANLLVVTVGSGNGVIVGTIVNAADQEDALLGVAVNGSATTFTGKNALPKNSPIIFEGDSANAKAVIGGFGAPAGSRVTVSLFFARAGEVSVDAIVRDTRDIYAGITADVVPTAPTK